MWAAGGIVSTINHSNTAEEIAFAVRIIKPKIFIVDAAIIEKLDKVISLVGRPYKVISLLARVQGYPLVGLGPLFSTVTLTD